MVSKEDLRKARNREKARRYRERRKGDPEYKEQVRQSAAKHRALYPEKIKAAKKRHYDKNAERLREQTRLEWRTDVEASRAKNRAYHQRPDVKQRRQARDKQEHVKLRRLEREATPEAKAKQSKKNALYRQVKPDKMKALQKDWRQRNRIYTRQACANRYAKRKGAAGSHTHEEWVALVAQYGGCCAYCGGHGPVARDHVLPLTKGGSDYIENVLPSCGGCNTSKGNRVMPHELEEWRSRRRALREKLAEIGFRPSIKEAA